MPRAAVSSVAAVREAPAREVTLVRGGTVVTPEWVEAADVVLEGERIAAIESPGTVDSTGAEVVDAGGLVVMPGCVDPHVHFQEPGREEWEGFDTGSAAAVAGGVTTVVDMPIDCDPPTVSVELLQAKADAARRHSRVDVGLWAGLVPASVGQLAAMAAAGAVGFKAFACPSGWDEFPAVDETTLAAGLAVAAEVDLPVAVHCEFADLGHTAASEVAAVRWAASLAGEAAAHLHVVHVSAAAAVEEARRWPGVTVETCPHYLMLEERDVTRIGAAARCAPPIRDAENRAALWDHVLAGDVDCIASDHSPCPPARRDGPAGWAGIEGVGTTLPVLLSSGRLGLRDVARLTTSAARWLRLRRKGAVVVGADADLALVDPDATWEIGPTTLWSRHRQSPYVGRSVKGQVMRTLVRGRTVYTRNEGPAEAGGGQWVRPGPRSIRSS